MVRKQATRKANKQEDPKFDFASSGQVASSGQLRRKSNKQADSKVDLSVWVGEDEVRAEEQERAMHEAVDAASRFVSIVKTQTGWRGDDPRFARAWQALVDALELYEAASWA
jgi:hypothetical protein